MDIKTYMQNVGVEARKASREMAKPKPTLKI